MRFLTAIIKRNEPFLTIISLSVNWVDLIMHNVSLLISLESYFGSFGRILTGSIISEGESVAFYCGLLLWPDVWGSPTYIIYMVGNRSTTFLFSDIWLMRSNSVSIFLAGNILDVLGVFENYNKSNKLCWYKWLWKRFISITPFN